MTRFVSEEANASMRKRLLLIGVCVFLAVGASARYSSSISASPAATGPATRGSAAQKSRRAPGG